MIALICLGNRHCGLVACKRKVVQEHKMQPLHTGSKLTSRVQQWSTQKQF
jgi:hypothetical protein